VVESEADEILSDAPVIRVATVSRNCKPQVTRSVMWSGKIRFTGRLISMPRSWPICSIIALWRWLRTSTRRVA